MTIDKCKQEILSAIKEEYPCDTHCYFADNGDLIIDFMAYDWRLGIKGKVLNDNIFKTISTEPHDEDNCLFITSEFLSNLFDSIKDAWYRKLTKKGSQYL